MRKLCLIPFLVILLGCSQEEASSEPRLISDFDSTLVAPEQLLSVINQQLEAAPDDYTLWQQRAEIYYQMDSIEAAIADIDHALSIHRNGPDLHYLRGFFAYGKGELQKAKIEYLTAEGLGTQNADVYYQLGQVYFFLKQDDSARYYYRRAQKFKPDDPHYEFALGLMAEERGKKREAVTHYVEALKVDSTFDKVLLQLHKRYMDEPFEHEATAMQYLNQLLRQDPGHPLGRHYEGIYRLKLAERNLASNQQEAFGNSLNEAITAFTIATNRQPNFGEAWYYRGYAYFLGQQNIEQAIENFQKAVEVSPEDPRAYFMLGSIFENTGDLKTALKYYETAFELRPSSHGFERAVKEVKEKLSV